MTTNKDETRLLPDEKIYVRKLQDSGGVMYRQFCTADCDGAVEYTRVQLQTADTKAALDAQVYVDEFVARNDSEGYPFEGEEYDVNLIKFAFEWLFSSDKFRASLTAQQPDVPEWLKTLDYQRDLALIWMVAKGSKDYDDTIGDRIQRVQQLILEQKQAIDRAEQKGGV